VSKSDDSDASVAGASTLRFGIASSEAFHGCSWFEKM
jgi:hypothetical protein